MPRIPEDTIDLVRQSVDIVEIISDHVILKKQGKNHTGLCPFHDDRKPSFSVSQDKQIYKCFSCGAGGNAFSFLMHIEGISFIEAVRKLAGRAGIPLPESRGEDRQQESFDLLYNTNELARKYFHHLLLNDSTGSVALEYLTGRGVSRDILDAFSLGYSPNVWDGFLKVATRRGFDPQTLERAGLILPRRSGTGYYDRFRHRVMFPILSRTGRPVAFGARALDADEQAKYLNSPETPVYHKSASLYGLWENRDPIRTEGSVLVVEGYMDLLALVQHGIANVVASSGTALTPDHARLLSRFAQRATLVFDGDAAGNAATLRGIGSLLETGTETRVATLPESHDPDSYVREHGPDAFRALLENATPLLDFMMDALARQEDLSTTDGKARAAEVLADLFSRIKDPLRQGLFVREAAGRLGVDEDALRRLSRRSGRTARRRDESEPEPRPQPFNPHPRWERELLIWMMSDNSAADTVLSQVQVTDFSNSAYRRIAALMAQTREQNQSVAPAALLDRCEEADLSQIISTLSMEDSNPENPDLPLQHYLDEFKRKHLEAQIDAIEAQMRTPGPDTDIRTLLETHKELTLQKKTLLETRQQYFQDHRRSPPVL